MLSQYRVLDLTTGRAAIGPLILADLGADVVKIEPPGGSPERARTACFAALNRNKRSVEVDLASESGRSAFRKLVTGAHFLFENARPGSMAGAGLDFDSLRSANSRLVYVAITAFGQDGPYSGFQATDLTLSAMGGMMAVN